MPAPPGRTLVALVDARGPSAGAPRVVLRGVPTPAVPLPFPDFVPPEGAAGVGYLVGGDHPVWTSALRADPVVGAFLEGHGARLKAPPPLANEALQLASTRRMRPRRDDRTVLAAEHSR